ncbi:MAG: hypothetical protein PVI75_04705 [Gammaproteobacteria bacterium]|jgi:hypothetical protein
MQKSENNRKKRKRIVRHYKQNKEKTGQNNKKRKLNSTENTQVEKKSSYGLSVNNNLDLFDLDLSDILKEQINEEIPTFVNTTKENTKVKKKTPFKFFSETEEDDIDSEYDKQIKLEGFNENELENQIKEPENDFGFFLREGFNNYV